MPATVLPQWTFANRLRKVRTEFTDYTMVGMSQALGVGESRYTAWETGRNVPRPALMLELAAKIESLTGIPAVWTLGG